MSTPTLMPEAWIADWQRRQTLFRASQRVALTPARRTEVEPMAAFYDRRIALAEGRLRWLDRFSRRWWMDLGRVVVWCFVAEYHRHAGTERSTVVGWETFGTVIGTTT
jgi:hypothetical protein